MSGIKNKIWYKGKWQKASNNNTGQYVTLNKANKSIYHRKAHNKQGNVTVKLIAFDHKQIICLLKGLEKLGAFK